MNPTFHLNDDVLGLVNTILKNAITNPKELTKYGKINLTGKAGVRLVACEESIKLLEDSGFKKEEIDGKLYLLISEISSATSENYKIVENSIEVRANSKTVEIAKPLSIKQQAQKDKEEAEKAERMQQYKNKKPKTNLRQEGREMERLKEKEEKENAKLTKANLLAKIQQDNHVRKHDENWTTEAAGDKSKGKAMLTFRDKNGEDKGG